MDSQSEMNLTMAMLMASATMQKLANRKPPTAEQILAKEMATTEKARILEAAEIEEMQRSPRAYRRRQAKLNQTKGDK